jgi:hypothetical protein
MIDAPVALIVPHAGRVYSGRVAASAYRRLAERRVVIRRVVVLGPAHSTTRWRGVAGRRRVRHPAWRNQSRSICIRAGGEAPGRHDVHGRTQRRAFDRSTATVSPTKASAPTSPSCRSSSVQSKRPWSPTSSARCGLTTRRLSSLVRISATITTKQLPSDSTDTPPRRSSVRTQTRSASAQPADATQCAGYSKSLGSAHSICDNSTYARPPTPLVIDPALSGTAPSPLTPPRTPLAEGATEQRD